MTAIIKQVLNLPQEIPLRDSLPSHKLPAKAAQTIAAMLPSLPDPHQSVRALSRLMNESPAAAQEIASDPVALRYALTVFSWSRFLSEAVIRHPNWLLDLAAVRDLHHGFLAEQYEDLLEQALPPGGAPRPADLALFRRRQLLRIGLRDVLNYADLSETAEDLSSLADAILNAAWRTVRAELARERGVASPGKFSILALGKLGGRELNYSSDIDLMFICSDEAAGLEFFRTAANRITHMLSGYSEEGVCYRVDLRLRPDGRYGEICHSVEGAKRYYGSRGRDWELQMLIKARVAAGDAGPGRELLAAVEPLIYATTTDFHTIEAVSETRSRIHEKSRRSRHSGLNVKLAKGGIRDIEFLVQCLQRLHGGQDVWVRHGGTLLALSRLRDKELLSPAEYARLASAYQFLRHLEHRLQFDEDRQTHTLPMESEKLDLLARKMPQSAAGPAAPSGETLRRELESHLADVSDLYGRVIHSRLPAVGPVAVSDRSPAETEPAAGDVDPEDRPARGEFPSANLKRWLDQRAPALSQLIAGGAIARSQQSFESFLEKILAEPEWLELLENEPEVARCTVEVFEHSRYFADQLVRRPNLLEEVRAACGERQGRTGFRPPRDPEELRRFFRQQMVRIQSDSVYHRVPVFRTLACTSELAQSIIAGAYEMAITDACAAAPPHKPDYTPSDQMMVVALGRLGMLEFDLASDADLIFVIPDRDAAENLFWTGVAERMIGVISAYTGDGVVFSIDTRLRPNGREGALVQTESAYRDYFAQRAEAWEGIAYMKARAIAGNAERATTFLGELQEIDWRRWGQSGRSREDLAAMRTRLEREQGARNPLKAGAGGYYDIDFALMYLRLRSAGMFFKVLNTPERIDVIEKMGHLDRAEADFLCGAATFHRAVDHGMRVSFGHALERLPANRAQLATLTELVHRWTPASLHEGTLDEVLKRLRRETRAFFNRLFAPR